MGVLGGAEGVKVADDFALAGADSALVILYCISFNLVSFNFQRL